MKAIVSQLKSLLSKNANRKRREGFPVKVRELSVELAASVGVKKASIMSGISAVSIYSWIRKGIYSPKKKVNSSHENRLVLQEIDVLSTPFFPTVVEIRLVSSRGVTAYLPADDKTLASVLDRMMEIQP